MAEQGNTMSIEKVLGNVEKTISTTTAGGAAGLSTNVLVRENLADAITKLSYLETAIRDRLSRKQGSGLAASWVVMTGITAGNSAFAEGGTPTQDNATFARRSAVYKEYGKTKSITDKMMAAGRSFADEEALQTEIAMREVVQDEERDIVTGNSGVNALQFDGLQTYITTNVTDDANNPLGFRVDLVDSAAEVVWKNRGARPTAVYSGYGMKRAINQSLIGDMRVDPNTIGAKSTTGTDVGYIQTMLGKLEVVPTIAIAGSAVGANTVEELYIVTEQKMGEDVLYMEDLYALGKVPLARTGAAISFMVTEATVLVCRAEEFQYKYQNVRVA